MERIKNLFLKYLPIWISIALFLVPFFWFKSGEMDLGGDSSRLYFYDPFAYLKNYAFYGISPSAFGAENIGYFMAPFVFLLVILKFLLVSPTILIAFFHGLNLSIAFLAIYAIVKDLSREHAKNRFVLEASSIIAGLIYVLSQPPIYGWEKVLAVHSQFFLNPLMFFLLLRYFKNNNTLYLASFLLISFVFSPNFSFAAAPAFFAFYPLGLFFLFFHTLFILKKKIIWRHILISITFFILLQSFHIMPQVASMLSTGSVLNTTVFSDAGKLDRGLGYFSAILPNIKVSLNLMNLPQMTKMNFPPYFFIIFPCIIIFGFIFNKSKTILLTGGILLITLYFASANITNIGVYLYKALFYLPGFSMFRNFYGQWGYVLLFFYAILFGLTLAVVLSKLRKRYQYALLCFLTLLVMIAAAPFLNGSLINKVIWQSNNIKIFMQMDPQYEEVIEYISDIPVSARFLTLPLTDPGYQIVKGTNNGAYQGPSTIAYLAGKQDFSGTVELGIYNQDFLLASKFKDYERIHKILMQLGVRYIFYNSDPAIYEKGFPTFPYAYGKEYLPVDQKGYKRYVESIGFRLKKKIGKHYFIYESEDNNFLPTAYASQRNLYINKPFLELPKVLPGVDKQNNRSLYLDTTFPYLENKKIIDEAMMVVNTQDLFGDLFIRRPDSKIPSAFISRNMNSFEYPYVVIREDNKLRGFKEINDEYIDRSIFYAEKRLNELERWSSNVDLLKYVKNIKALDEIWKEPKLNEFRRYNEYNSWEIGMVRYERAMSSLIKKISGPIVSAYPAIVNKLYIERILILHRERLKNIIVSSSLPEKDKVYLLRLSRDMFEQLVDDIDINIPKTNALSFKLDNLVTDKYDVYINNDDMRYLRGWTLSLGEKQYVSDDLNSQSEWIKINNFTVKKNQGIPVTLKVSDYPNLVSNSQWKRLDNVDIAGNLVKYEIFDNSFLDTQGMLREIKNWDSDSKYLISFDYHSHGKEFNLQVDEKLSTQKTTAISSNVLFSNKWNKFEVVISSARNAEAAFLHIQKNKDYFTDLVEKNEENDTQIELKNLSVIKIPNPKIILKKSEGDKNKLAVPAITFKKINPTKYKIYIKNAKDPYTLSFLQEFNSKWELYMVNEDNKGLDEGSKITDYFGSSLSELKQEEGLLDANPLETFGSIPIAKNRHFKASGYLNAWYIEPADVGNRKDYTLVIEFKTQKTFYVGLIISLTSFILLLIFLIHLLRSYGKKNN